MVFSTQSLLKRLAGGATLVALILLLVACGGNKGTAGSNNNNGTSANPVKQLVPTTTAAAVATQGMTAMTATPNAMAATPAVLDKTYTGTGFTIQYPATWKVTTSNSEAAFTDPAGDYNLTIGSTSNPNGVKTATQLADGGITGARTNLKSVQTVNMPATMTVAGQSWNQQAISGTSTLNGQSSDVEAVVLANNHPTNNVETKGYVIVYVTGKDKFDQAQAKYFLPMLQSFKYTA